MKGSGPEKEKKIRWNRASNILAIIDKKTNTFFNILTFETYLIEYKQQ